MLSYNLEKSLSLLLVETIRNFHHALLVLFPREMVFDIPWNHICGDKPLV